jgi:hypothetical protein
MGRNMPEAHQPAASRGHEVFDLDLSYVRWFSLAIVLLLIVTAAAAFALMGGFRVAQPSAFGAPLPDQAPAQEAAQGPRGEATPAPFAQLQSAPQDDLRAYRRTKAATLEGYHWVDRSAGVVQIPIERAMQLLATATPLPVQAPPHEAPQRLAAHPGRGQHR